MGNTKYYARKVAEAYVEEGRCVVTESEVIERIKEEYGMSAPWTSHVRSGVEWNGWEIEDRVYHHSETLVERTREVSGRLRAEGRPVVARSVVSRAVADADRPAGEWGTEMDDTMADEGWRVDRENDLYFLPPTELATESSLSYYLLNSFSVPE